MTTETRTATKCRARADECRAIADRISDEQRRQEMLKVAETWEVLARDNERMDQIWFCMSGEVQDRAGRLTTTLMRQLGPSQYRTMTSAIVTRRIARTRGRTAFGWTVGGGFDGDPEYHDDMEHLCGDVAKVLDLCGARDMRFRSEAIFDARAHVWPLLALFDPAPGAGLSIPTNLMKDHESLPRRANVYKAFRIGDVALAYFVTVELEVETDGDGLVWRSTVIEPGEVTVLSGHENDYHDFVEQTRVRTGVALFFIGEREMSQSSSPASRS